jgi:hypothetical protein
MSDGMDYRLDPDPTYGFVHVAEKGKATAKCGRDTAGISIATAAKLCYYCCEVILIEQLGHVQEWIRKEEADRRARGLDPVPVAWSE